MNVELGSAYTRASLANIVGLPRLAATREGVVTHDDDVLLFVTLDKAGQANVQLHYNDFFEGRVFHWDSQNTQHFDSPVIQNMVRGRVAIHLFARIHQKIRGETQTFYYCGRLDYRSHDPLTRNPVHIEFNLLSVQAPPNSALQDLYAWRPRVTSVYASTRVPAGPGAPPQPGVSSVNPAAPIYSVMPGDLVPTAAPVKRLGVAILEAATPELIWLAIQELQEGSAVHRFGKSADYDLVTDDGARLPPKAVFGIALAKALNDRSIGPEHFSAGETSPCFRLLRAAGYAVIAKSAVNEVGNNHDADEDREWREGDVKLGPHRRRERGAGMARAKKAQFIRNYGKLFCEHCLLDPVASYGTELAASCIEVHHRDTQVQDMAPLHATRLRHLICLCANCHRLEHRRLATTNSVSGTAVLAIHDRVHLDVA